ncbi:MAG: alpha/beta fold hydrolase, partial [Pseudonocardiaceae bacterium]
YLIPGNDLVLPPEDQLRTARDIPGGRAVILNGYGHLLPGENPALVAYEIGSWLNHVRTSVAHA